MAKELLLEIGTEEIPADFFPKVLTDMDTLIRREFDANRIGYGEIVTYGTPRRLVLMVRNISEKQADQLIEKIGPAKKSLLR